MERCWRLEPIFIIVNCRIGGESGAGVRVSGSDWTNVIIPGADRSYREKQVKFSVNKIRFYEIVLRPDR